MYRPKRVLSSGELDKRDQFCQSSPMSDPHTSTAVVDSRRRRVLDAAGSVFIRLGFRKASMEAVARAANVSRQGLYLHFATKEDLFREVVRDHFGRALVEVERVMADPGRSLGERLIAAFDAWHGRALGMRGAEVDELLTTCRALLSDLVDANMERFERALLRAAEAEERLVEECRARGVTTEDWSRCALALALGLKLAARDRDEFRRELTRAVRLILPSGAV